MNSGEAERSRVDPMPGRSVEGEADAPIEPRRSTRFTIRLLEGFDDPRLSPELWAALLPRGETDVVFLTLEWQRTWWEVFGRGQLLLIAVERGPEIVALAPLFCDGGMVFLVGSGGSDYLDLVGDFSDGGILDLVLKAAQDAARDFVGFRFYHVPDRSRTGGRLREAALRVGLMIFDEGDLVAPAMDVGTDGAGARAASEKESLTRRERWFRREGRLVVEHGCNAAQILPHLEAFFAQHVARWAGTPFPSLFNDPAQRRFFSQLAERAGGSDWLRFTRVVWNDQLIAAHFGFCYGGNYLWYKPSFDLALAKRSPGEVLLRQLLLEAIAEGAHTFDFGLGDEAFKHRFANRLPTVRTWGLYPPKSVEKCSFTHPFSP